MSKPFVQVRVLALPRARLLRVVAVENGVDMFALELDADGAEALADAINSAAMMLRTQEAH